MTHDQSEALALSHRIAVMNHGRVEQLDEPSKIYGFPKNRFVADFIGHCNLLDGEVKACERRAHDRASRRASARFRALNMRRRSAGGREGVLALRPEKVAIGRDLPDEPDLNRFAGKVHDFLYLGDVTVYIVELAGGTRIEALLPNSAAGRAKFFEVGDAVRDELALRRRALSERLSQRFLQEPESETRPTGTPAQVAGQRAAARLSAGVLRHSRR